MRRWLRAYTGRRQPSSTRTSKPKSPSLRPPIAHTLILSISFALSRQKKIHSEKPLQHKKSPTAKERVLNHPLSISVLVLSYEFERLVVGYCGFSLCCDANVTSRNAHLLLHSASGATRLTHTTTKPEGHRAFVFVLFRLSTQVSFSRRRRSLTAGKL